MPSKKPAPKKTGKPVAKSSKPVIKSASSAKKVVPTKKAVPVKKVVVTKQKAKSAVKPSAKPATKIVSKSAPAKKAAPVKAAPAKKATPIKSKVAAKPAPKSSAPVVSKKPMAKPISKTPEKPVAKPTPIPVKKAVTPAPTPAATVLQKPKAPAVKAAPAAPVKPVKKQPEPIKDIKVPKTNVKTSVPYKPMYTPLEKREEPKTGLNQTLVKYSDTDLADFRELIGKKLEAAKKELAYLQGLITRKDEMGGDNDDARYMTMEDGSMSMEREQLSQMASRQITYIDHLEKAIMRIENKTYGICRVTGKLIDKARLRAVPHATLSLEAKLGLVRHSAE